MARTWIWVRDDATGAHYDVDATALRPGMTPVEGYPPNHGPHPRPTKTFVDKAGQPALPAGRATEPASDENPSTTEPPAPPADQTEEQP